MKNTKWILQLGIGVVSSLTLFTGCNKQDEFLNAKPNEALAVPATLGDLQALLQNESLFNADDPALGEISSDDFYVVSADWNSLNTTNERNAYLWAPAVYDAGADVKDWSSPYQQVYYANTVLEALPKMPPDASQPTRYNQVKGTALFYRSIAFYNLLQIFALPYDSAAAAKDLGIPLILSADLNTHYTRATQQQCYDQLVKDLQTALSLLPVTAAYRTEPSQVAVNALLARIYLVMGNYNQALQYASDCLAQNNKLVDYNTLTPGSAAISTAYLPEDIYHTRMHAYGIVIPNNVSVTDSTLYKSYGANDLRKTAFFIVNNGLPYFRGSYDYKKYSYNGLATDEIFLIRAECYARLGNTAAAMNDLNTLLVSRWKTGTFIAYTAASADDAVSQVIAERRKELLYRGLRWTDLRRLNKDSRYATTLTRVINGTTYTLGPNDPRYALPIPDNEVQVSGLIQNQR